MITRALFLFLLSHNIMEANNWVIHDKISLEVHEIFTFGHDEADEDDEDDENDSGSTHADQLEKPPITTSLPSSKQKKRQASNENAVTWRIVTKNQTDIAYDYEQFKSEYDHDIEILKEDRAKLNESEFRIIPKSNCKADRFYNKGPFTAICLLNEYSHGATKQIKTDAGAALTNIFTLWGILLVVFLIFGWGHYGCCNDCCPLSICHPEDGYEEIKQYLVLNPPGTMLKKVIAKKTDSSRTVAKNVYYKPTEMEYYLYNKLWNKLYQA